MIFRLGLFASVLKSGERTRTKVIGAIAAVLLAAGCAATGGAPATGPALFVVRDADSTLYLYGTIHLRRAGAPWGSPAVEAALDRSEEIWTEMEVSPAAEARSRQLALQQGLAPPGRPLSSWLSAEERTRLAAAEARLGVQPQALEALRPWLAGLTLTLAPMIQAGYDPAAGVDRAIDAYGDARNKRMRFFETPDDQVGFMAGLPDDVQRAMLMEAVDEADEGAQMLDALSAAWDRGDVPELERLLNEDMRDEYPDVYEALIRRRNQAWMIVLMQELHGAGVDFVAVGAAHIVGPDGLVEQLRRRGLRVERVR